MRYGKYKAIRIEKDGIAHFELYDLEKDLAEKHNIADSFPVVVEDIKEMMYEAYEYTDDYPRKIK